MGFFGSIGSLFHQTADLVSDSFNEAIGGCEDILHGNIGTGFGEIFESAANNELAIIDPLNVRSDILGRGNTTISQMVSSDENPDFYSYTNGKVNYLNEY